MILAFLILNLACNSQPKTIFQEEKIQESSDKPKQDRKSTTGTFIFSRFLGGQWEDDIGGVVIDSRGNIIVTGVTMSSDFPIFQPKFPNVTHGSYLTKFSPNGIVLWSTYIAEASSGYAVAVDTEDNIILVGNTITSDFPIKSAYDSVYNGDCDAYVMKLTKKGIQLWSTYIGGSKSETAYAVTIDHQNSIIITGSTYSADFPLLNAYRSSYCKTFVSKFSSDGVLLFSTFLEGEEGHGLAVDSHDNLFVVGNGNSDSFITKFSQNGSHIFSSLIGGESSDFGSGVAVDSQDNIIFVGCTRSSEFPTLNARDPSYNGKFDVFISKFSTDSVLIWSSYLGGENDDLASSVVVDKLDNILISGTTHSVEFPIVNAINDSNNGRGDVFLTKVNSTGSLIWSTYIGGSKSDDALAITLDEFSNPVIGGATESADYPVTMDIPFRAGECEEDNTCLDAFISYLLDPLIKKYPKYSNSTSITDTTIATIDSTTQSSGKTITQSTNIHRSTGYPVIIVPGLLFSDILIIASFIILLRSLRGKNSHRKNF